MSIEREVKTTFICLECGERVETIKRVESKCIPNGWIATEKIKLRLGLEPDFHNDSYAFEISDKHDEYPLVCSQKCFIARFNKQLSKFFDGRKCIRVEF